MWKCLGFSSTCVILDEDELEKEIKKLKEYLNC